jgi:hypothetical protein
MIYNILCNYNHQCHKMNLFNDDAALLNDDIIPSQNDVNDVIQLPINMTDASLQLRNALHLAASGVVPCISLEEEPAMLHTMNIFVDDIYKNKLKYCTICNENWFPGNKCDDDNISYVCCRCVKEKKLNDDNNNVLFVGTMSAANNMNPFHHTNQLALHELNDLEVNYSLNSQEQALIAISTPIISFLKLKGPKDGQQTGYSGNVVNVAQDLTEICLELPRLPANCNVFKVRSVRGTDPANYKDFIVRRHSTIYHLIIENAMECLRISEFCEKPEVTGFRYFLNFRGDIRNPCFVS